MRCRGRKTRKFACNGTCHTPLQPATWCGNPLARGARGCGNPPCNPPCHTIRTSPLCCTVPICHAGFSSNSRQEIRLLIGRGRDSLPRTLTDLPRGVQFEFSRSAPDRSPGRQVVGLNWPQTTWFLGATDPPVACLPRGGQWLPTTFSAWKPDRSADCTGEAFSARSSWEPLAPHPPTTWCVARRWVSAPRSQKRVACSVFEAVGFRQVVRA